MADRLLTISQVVNLTGASPQLVKQRIFSDQVPGATIDGEGDDERVVIPQAAYEAALKTGVFNQLSGRHRLPRIPRTCANPACGLTFLVISTQAEARGPFCSLECAQARTPDGILRHAEAGAYIATLRGEEKPLSRERVRQYVMQGRLPTKMTRADIDAAWATGDLAPKPGKRGKLKAPRGWMTTADVAAKTGLSTSIVGDLCAKGEITATQERGGYLISQPAFRRWVAASGAEMPVPGAENTEQGAVEENLEHGT